MPLTNKQFMTIGSYLFSIIGIFNLLFFLAIFQTLHIYQMISQLAGILFNFLLAYMFAVWSFKEKTIEDYNEPDNIEDLINKAKIKNEI